MLVAFPDMQGRLIGKRFQAEFFLEGAIDETHGCDYLLADDIDMEPVPGYEAANWDKGYGDFVMKPDLATLMKATWLEGTALVLADLVDHHHHEPIPHSPRAILKAQLARLATAGLHRQFRLGTRILPVRRDFRTVHDKGYRNLKTAGYYIEDYHIFQTTKEEGVMRALRKQLQASGIPVENSKGEWGPGQEEINVKYADALTMADRHVVMKNATKEIAHAQGKAVTFMAKWDFGLAGSSSHIHMSLADKAGKNAFIDAKDALGMSPIMKQFMAGLLDLCARHHLFPRALHQFLQALPGRHLRADQGDLEPRQPHRRLPPLRREHARASASNAASAAPTSTPISPIAALIAAGLKGIEDKLELEPAFPATPMSGKKLREVPKTLREATADAAEIARC